MGAAVEERGEAQAPYLSVSEPGGTVKWAKLWGFLFQIPIL